MHSLTSIEILEQAVGIAVSRLTGNDVSGLLFSTFFFIFNFFVAQAAGIPVDQRSGGRLATTLVATKDIFIFFFQKTYLAKVDGSAQNPRGFSGHLGPP